MAAILILGLLAAEPATGAAPMADGPLPEGAGEFTVSAQGERLRVFTFKPANYDGRLALVVCHGVLRNAEEYRDHSRGMAERYHALVIAPKFEEAAFPLERYQFGGVAVKGQVKPKEYWSGGFVAPILAEVRRREGKRELPYRCIGHSGGGQFLARMAGFAGHQAKSVVVANAGTHLFPTRDLPYPYGFGGLPDELSGDAALKRYLEQPVTFYLGRNDTERDEHFDVTPPAEKQGKTRLERGRNCVAAGRALAESKGWVCQWKLVEADEVGHDHEKMFDHERCRQALFGDAAD